MPAGVLPRAGKEWTPQREQFLDDKVEWVRELLGGGGEELVKMRRGPGGVDVDGVGRGRKEEER